MSKFDQIFTARNTETEKQKIGSAKSLSNKNSKPKKAKTVKKKPPEEKITAVEKSKKESKNRIKGKSNNPDFIGFTTYIQRTTHTDAKIALLKEGKSRELSELVENLLVNWINAQKG